MHCFKLGFHTSPFGMGERVVRGPFGEDVNSALQAPVRTPALKLLRANGELGYTCPSGEPCVVSVDHTINFLLNLPYHNCTKTCCEPHHDIHTCMQMFLHGCHAFFTVLLLDTRQDDAVQPRPMCPPMEQHNQSIAHNPLPRRDRGSGNYQVHFLWNIWFSYPAQHHSEMCHRLGD